MNWRLLGAWTLLIGSILGMAVTFPLWLLNLVSDRALLGRHPRPVLAGARVRSREHDRPHQRRGRAA